MFEKKKNQFIFKLKKEQHNKTYRLQLAYEFLEQNCQIFNIQKVH
jgi:hypothetical protein